MKSIESRLTVLECTATSSGKPPERITGDMTNERAEQIYRQRLKRPCWPAPMTDEFRAFCAELTNEKAGTMYCNLMGSRG